MITRRRALPLTLTTLALLAGCQAPMPTMRDVESRTGGAVHRDATVGTANQRVRTELSPTEMAKAAKMDPADPANPLSAPPAGFEGQVVLFVKAAEGARYTSADGTLSAVIPPGALSRDSFVTFLPGSTARNVMPGISFQADLGGAMIAPDKAIMVTAVADPRTVPTMKAMDPTFAAEKYSLSQDATGQWQLTMPMNGPTTHSKTAADAPVNPWLMVEEGSLNVPFSRPTAALSLLKRYKVACNNGDISTDGLEICHGGNWLCYPHNPEAFPSPSPYVPPSPTPDPSADPGATPDPGASTDPAPSADPTPEPPPPPPPPPPPVTVTTHVTWISDDPTLMGFPAEGGTVNFYVSNSIDYGPSSVAIGADGIASTWVRDGADVQMLPFTTVPELMGGMSASGTAGPLDVNLEIPKFSPVIVVHMLSKEPLPPEMMMSVAIDGAMRPPVTTAVRGAGALVGDALFQVRVPNDADHELRIGSISNALGTLIGEPLPPPMMVHRNGTYNATVNLDAFAK